jgi:hypothetical protein
MSGTIKSQGDVRRLFHVVQQRALSLFVRLPDGLVRYLVGIFQDFRLMRPLRDDGLKKPSHFGVGPGRRMHPIGDRPHLIAWEDLFRRLRVTLRDSVDVAAQAERELRHVQALLAAMTLQLGEVNVISQRLLDQCIGKSVNARFNRRVCREHTALSHLCVIVERNACGNAVWISVELTQ